MDNVLRWFRPNGPQQAEACCGADIDRLTRATAIIERFSARHVTIDVGIGIVGIVPSLGTIAVVSAIAIQAPVIYQPMVREIGRLYRREQDETLRGMEAGAAIFGGAVDLGVQFGVAFIKESAWELITENSVSCGLSWLPLVGGVISAGLDAILARKMTRLVGAMALVYYENSGAWLGSRRKTRAIVKAALKTSISADVPTIVQSVLRDYGVSIQLTSRVNSIQPSPERGTLSAVSASADGIATGIADGSIVDGINPFVLEALDRCVNAGRKLTHFAR